MSSIQKLAEAASDLSRVLSRSQILTPPRFAVSEVKCQAVSVIMRDGVRLATDVYLPPLTRCPTVAVRTPYGRGLDIHANAFLSLARRGYAVVAQDCRGTGGSEPNHWDYYMYEQED